MYKSLLISAAFCLLLFTSGFYCDPPKFIEKSSRRYNPLPNCTEAMKQNETATQLAKCPTVNRTGNLSDPADCCQFWKGFSCEKDILYTLPACKSSLFLIEMQVNLGKPADTCAQSPLSCTKVNRNVAITTITENIFRPLSQRFENATFASCTNDTKEGMVNCMLQFDNLLNRITHPDAVICCDELAFKDCAMKVTDSQASCSLVKTQLESLYTTMEKNVAKKCPEMGPHCKRNGTPNVSLSLLIFTFSFMVAFFVRN